MKNKSNRLAAHMLIAMVAGIAAGIGLMILRENVGADSNLWLAINRIFFQDITAEGAENAIGLFYIGGQLFVKSLQLVIVPMVFTSIVMAIGAISDASTLGRISVKTIGWFLCTSIIALVLAGAVGLGLYRAGVFSVTVENVAASTGSTGANPLNVILNIIPSNMIATFGVNTGVLSVIFIAIVIGLGIKDKGKDSVIYRFCEEASDVIVKFLNFVVSKVGPIAIFMLLSRTFATYGIHYLRSAMAYVIVTVALLLAYLFIVYPLIVALTTKKNPFIYIKKIFKVIVFGFSTSSSAATLPLNLDTNTKELGVDNQIASFVLPFGMTINMDGTAIMQVVATLFLAAVGGYEIGIGQLVLIMVLALIASVGTPASPGAGAVILFTILAGAGITGDAVMMGYTLILAINRPIEMLVTSLNCVGDSLTSIAVAKSEGKLDEDIFNS
ncbi:MAG: dicarboxylate/amino acid:cation symporter [Clostridia bacterium]|nr:dicarboxylate/amino acid:cation symporter [Clostridia bacterium]